MCCRVRQKREKASDLLNITKTAGIYPAVFICPHGHIHGHARIKIKQYKNEGAGAVLGEDLELKNLLEGRKKSKKPDRTFEFLLMQIAVCILALLAAFCIKFAGGDIYNKTRDKYIAMINDPTGVDEVIETVAGVFKLTELFDTSSNISDVSNAKAVNAEPDTSSAPDPGSITAPPSEPASSSAASFGNTSQNNSSALPSGENEADGAIIYDFANIQQQLSAGKTRTNSMTAPTNGTITSRFEYRIHPFTGQYTMHSGLDIAADSGTPIIAAMDGTVKTIAQSSSYGIYLIISHGNGIETLYAHCSKILSKEGAKVSRGEKIALVGSTGQSTGPHCHFEVRVNGARINPEWVLPKSDKA